MSIKLYRSTYDEFDPTNNGGDITDNLIESGVLHSFMPRVRPRMAEIGGERWFKFFVKADVDIVSIGIDIAKYTKSEDEEIYIALENNHNEVESDIDKDNIRLFGGFRVVDIDKDNKQITADRDVSDFVKAGDYVTFYNKSNNRIISLKVDSVDEDKITFKILKDIEIGYLASSSLFVENINKDEYIGIWLKQTIKEYSQGIDPNSCILNIWYDKK